MKTLLTNLQATVTAGSYNKNTTSALGRAYQKTLDGESVIGPPLTKAIDVYTDTLSGTAVIPLFVHTTENNRMFVFSSISAAGVGTILYYTFDLATGADVYMGRIQYNTAPGTAVSIRSGVVNDRSSTLKIWVAATTTGVTSNGGLYHVANVNLADFAQVGYITVPLATGNGQRAVYKCDDPAAAGVLNTTTTTAVGLAVPHSAADAGINTKAIMWNGSAAVSQAFIWEGATAPSYVNQTCTTMTSNASPTFTMTSHGYVNGMNLVITANAPGNFTLTTTVQTVYVVRNAVADVSFELATLAAPTVSINCSTAVLPVLGRAYGVVTNNLLLKTGNLPALGAGTLLVTDAVGYCRPGHSRNANTDCVFLGANTNFYLVRISDLTSGTVILPSLDGANILGSGIDVIAPTAAFSSYDSLCDIMIYNTNTAVFVYKKIQNSSILGDLGYLSNQYIETLNPITLDPALSVITGIDSRAGWLFITSSAVGQRVVIALDMYSDAQFNYSKVISPILYVGYGSLHCLSTLEKYFDLTQAMKFYVRTADTEEDPMFDTVDEGWVLVSAATDLSNVELQDHIQVMALFGSTTTPSQLNDFVITYVSDNEISDHWEGSVDNTATGSPSYSAFRLTNAYQYPTASVPKLYFRAYADDGTLVVSADTVTDAANFTYTTNNGTSWNALGTVPNTEGTTELRYQWTTPPGVRVTVSLREG